MNAIRYRRVAKDGSVSFEWIPVTAEDLVNAERCAFKSAYTVEQRVRLAQQFGPNWASVVSGMGDQ